MIQKTCAYIAIATHENDSFQSFMTPKKKKFDIYLCIFPIYSKTFEFSILVSIC